MLEFERVDVSDAGGQPDLMVDRSRTELSRVSRPRRLSSSVMLVISLEVLGVVDEDRTDPEGRHGDTGACSWRRSYPASHVSNNRLRLAQSLLFLSIKPAIAVK
jgi:hypothetical protein